MAVAPGVDLDNLQPGARNGLLTAMSDLQKAGVNFTVTSGARSRDTQARLYDAYMLRGRTGLPAAPPGASNHESGEAVDISIADPAQRETANQILAKHGFQWLGPKDHVHYDYKGPGAANASDLLSAFNAPAAAPAAPKQDLLAAFNTSTPRPAKTRAAPPQKDLLAAFSASAPAAPQQDLLAAFGSAEPATALPQLGTPGNPRRSGGFALPPPPPEQAAALSYPRHATTGGNAPIQTDPRLLRQQDVAIKQQSDPVLGPLQRTLNRAQLPITLASSYYNNVVKSVAGQYARGETAAGLAPYMADIPAYIEAARKTPWSKLLVQGLVKGNQVAFPEPIHSFGEGAPNTPVGRLIAQHPVASTAMDFVLSFPIMEAMGAGQSLIAGRIGRGLSAANEATGAGERILSRVPKVKQFLQNQDIQGAAEALINKSQAGMQHYLNDAAKTAEDARVTSQKYLHAGVKLGYKSEHTGQPVNRFEELVADYMDAGNAGSKYEGLHPAPHQIQQDRAVAETMHGILTRAKSVVPGIVEKGPAGMAWSAAAKELRAELATPYAIPAETGAAQTLGAVTTRARETGPGVLRGLEYNDLGTAAQEAQRSQQRARELGTIAEEAASRGIDFADVQRIGDSYSRIYDNLGKHLVDTGLVDPDAWARLKGQYLPRLYLLTKGSPGDIDAFMGFLGKEGLLTKEALAEASQRGLTQRWGQGVGPRGFTKSRELTDFSERNAPEIARAMVPEATPAALHGIEAQTRAAGLARGMQEIAKNPEWALPVDQLTREHYQRGWVHYQGKGPLAGMAIHPAIQAALEAQRSPNAGLKLSKAIFGEKAGPYVHKTNQVVRQAMLAGPNTMANVGLGHYYFTASEAKLHGANFSGLDYARAAADMRAMAKGQKFDRYLQEALNQTDLLTSGASVLPKAAKRVSGGVGLETRGQNALRVAKGLGKKYLGTTHDVLAAGKFGLYRQLRRAGHSVDDAARITRQATISYTSLPNWVRTLDQGMIIPFFTFGYRAVPIVGRMALHRPDVVATASGQRLSYYLDRMADRLAQSRGQQPQAVADRQSGKVGPTTFALPGSTEQGRQRYAKAPLLAPLLHHWASGQDLTDVLTHPFVGALRSSNPIISGIGSAVNNMDLRSEDARPILPGYLPPGITAEKAGVIGSYLLHALAPPVGKLESFANAAHGTTPYPKAGLRPQTQGEAALGYLTGSRLGTAAALKPAAEVTATEQKALAEEKRPEVIRQERAAGGIQSGRFAMAYFQHLMAEHSRNPNFTPDAANLEKANSLPPHRFQEYLDAAKASLQNVVYGEHYTGKDREAAILRLLDWTYALAQSAQLRGMRPVPVFRGMGMGIGRPLARLGGG